mgnify:FL=1
MPQIFHLIVSETMIFIFFSYRNDHDRDYSQLIGLF